VKLALKHAPPRGLFKRLFHWLTAARLVTRYPHAGIVIDGDLMHSNLANGLHIETFRPEGWDLFDLGDADELAQARFRDFEGTPYDWFSLLAFVLPWSVSDSKRMYCYEWCWLAITGVNPRRRVTPEDLLALISTKTKGQP
jgi:hypothetical protein